MKKVIIIVVCVLLSVAITSAFEERITTKEAFDTIVENEKERLDIDVTVQTRFDFDGDTYCFQYGGEYYIVLGKENTVNAIRHEMYHIYQMENKKSATNEFAAAFYELTGTAL